MPIPDTPYVIRHPEGACDAYSISLARSSLVSGPSSETTQATSECVSNSNVNG